MEFLVSDLLAAICRFYTPISKGLSCSKENIPEWSTMSTLYALEKVFYDVEKGTRKGYICAPRGFLLTQDSGVAPD
jgi:hypothetical protein